MEHVRNRANLRERFAARYMRILQQLAQLVVAWREVDENLPYRQSHAGKMLGGAIVQIACNSSSFFILRGKKATSHFAQRILSLPPLPPKDKKNSSCSRLQAVNHLNALEGIDVICDVLCSGSQAFGDQFPTIAPAPTDRSKSVKTASFSAIIRIHNRAIVYRRTLRDET